MTIDYHYQSFKDAYAGLRQAFFEHPNFRIHLFLSILVIILAWYLNITRSDFILLVLTIFLGFVVEFLNTAIEVICDLITLEWRKNIMIAKNLTAAMMLLTAIGSVMIALLIFYPYIFSLFV